MRSWGKWVTEIRLKNTRARLWLGSYATPEQAAKAYDVALMCLRGSSASLNFPESPPSYAPLGLSHRHIQELAAKAGGATTFPGGSATPPPQSPLSDDDRSSSLALSPHNPSCDEASSAPPCSSFNADDDRFSPANSASLENPSHPASSSSQTHPPSSDEASSALPSHHFCENSSPLAPNLSHEAARCSTLSDRFGFNLLSDFEMLGPFEHFCSPFAGISHWEEITTYDLIAPSDKLEDEFGAFFGSDLWNL